MKCESMAGAVLSLAATAAGGGARRKDLPLRPLPVNMQLAAYYNVVTPDNGVDWQVRFQMQFMFRSESRRP